MTQVCRASSVGWVEAEQLLLGFLIKGSGISDEASKRQVKTKRGQILFH